MLSFVMFLETTQKAALNISLQIFLPNCPLQHHPLRCILLEVIFKLLSTGYRRVWHRMLQEIWESLGVSMNHWISSLGKTRIHTKQFIRKAPFPLPAALMVPAVSTTTTGCIKAWWSRGRAAVIVYGNYFDLHYKRHFKDDNQRPSPAPNKISSKPTTYLRESLAPGGRVPLVYQQQRNVSDSR